jgi:hypothetical protein
MLLAPSTKLLWLRRLYIALSLGALVGIALAVVEFLNALGAGLAADGARRKAATLHGLTLVGWSLIACLAIRGRRWKAVPPVWSIATVVCLVWVCILLNRAT